jgi:MazG family protein
MERVPKTTGEKFERLVAIMATLRGPSGCPWDKEQDFNSLKPMLVEEVYEVLEAVENNDFDGVAEELGDLLLHIVFHAHLGHEAGHFDINTVIDNISEKLIRRHPHVFGNATAGTADEVIKNWEAIKAKEKEQRLKSTREQRSLLEGIPSKLPAIHEAHQISSRAARVGFDWPDIEGIFDKLQEEVRELKDVISGQADDKRRERLEDEIGDILFVVVNISRYLKVDSESALKRANRKFKSRFQYMEGELTRQGKALDQVPLEEMEALWQKAKSEVATI